MRPVLALLLALLSAPSPSQTPVLVELFTSEGCSSCPPADELLARLAAHPEPGVRVVALGFHVDYWDALGWKDPFASPVWSGRQRSYAWATGNRQLYTPQMIIDGTKGFVGSDEATARARLREAVHRSRLLLSLHREGDELRLSGPATKEPLDLWIAWTEEGLSSAVGRGENAGRWLSHASIVRSLQKLPAPDPHEAWNLNLPATPPEGTRGRPKTLVAFLQHPKTMEVRGVATLNP